MQAGEKRVPLGSCEEVREVPWESALPGHSLGFRTGSGRLAHLWGLLQEQLVFWCLLLAGGRCGGLLVSQADPGGNGEVGEPGPQCIHPVVSLKDKPDNYLFPRSVIVKRTDPSLRCDLNMSPLLKEGMEAPENTISCKQNSPPTSLSLNFFPLFIQMLTCWARGWVAWKNEMQLFPNGFY